MTGPQPDDPPTDPMGPTEGPPDDGVDDGAPRRRVKLGAWFSPEEAEQVRARAGGPGKLAPFIRAAVLEGGAPRRRRLWHVPLEPLTRFLLQLGPLTDALRALADRPDIGRDDPALSSALAEVGDMSFAVLQLMGRGRPWRRKTAGADEGPESLAAIFARAHGPLPAAPVLPALPFPPLSGGPA